MNRSRTGHALLLIVGVLLAGRPPAVGDTPTVGVDATSAAARVEAMANLIATAGRIGVIVDCAYDVVEDSGAKIELGERRELLLRRPDRLRFEVTRRDGSHRGIFFDGTQITTFDRDEKVYAVVSRPGTIDAAMDYYRQDLQMRLPLAELFAADLPQKLKSILASARLIGKETVAGIPTDHVALRGRTTDVQVWIASAGDPLPQRVVITYRLAAGGPQFRADFHDWSLEPEVPDAAFVFVPPADAAKIPILTPRRGRPGDETQP